MKTIAIANQKGGTAKTTTTAALGVLLARTGVKTHVIDMDAQASLTAAFGESDDEGRLFDAISAGSPLPVVRIADNLTISPGNIYLMRAETDFLSRPAREYVLKSCLEVTMLPGESVVLIDCPPSLGILSIAALTAADALCLVVQPGGFELQTLVHLRQTVEILRQHVNPCLDILGAIITNCHRRRGITDQVTEELAQHYPVLGQVRADARLLYATTGGRIAQLTRSAALDDYGLVVDKLLTGYLA